MNHGVQHVEEELDVVIPEYTVSAVEVGSFYAHKWYIGCDTPCDATQVKTLIDTKLKEINDDYRVERASVLRDMEVEIIPVHIFYKWHEHQGKMGGQHKFPRVMKKERFRDWEEFVRRSLVN